MVQGLSCTQQILHLIFNTVIPITEHCQIKMDIWRTAKVSSLHAIFIYLANYYSCPLAMLLWHNTGDVKDQHISFPENLFFLSKHKIPLMHLVQDHLIAFLENLFNISKHKTPVMHLVQDHLIPFPENMFPISKHKTLIMHLFCYEKESKQCHWTMLHKWVT